MERSRTTGRYLVLLSTDDPDASRRWLPEPDATYFETLGIAVLSQAPDGIRAQVDDDGSPVLAYEEERVVWAIEGPPFADTDAETWGVQAVELARSQRTGKGVGLAILDTGVDEAHPDLKGRIKASRSFVADTPVADVVGHGTHCAGIAAGPAEPSEGPRYGVASEAELHIGKVLGDEGSGTDQDILAGIQWAIDEGCAIVSMSLGSPGQAGQPFSQVFEQAAQRALARGTTIIAAAGNESRRSEGVLAPVGHPANCPSIAAVGALDPALRVADFSCTSADSDGGKVDIAAPGVDIRSSWPTKDGTYKTISGTSMATPFVAGLAALVAESDADARGQALLDGVIALAEEIDAPAADVGVGLAQAPEG